MITLGVQLNHRTSVCLFDDDKLLYYNQEERILRKKDTDYFPITSLKEVKNITSTVDVVVFSGYKFDKNLYTLAFNFINEIGINVTGKWYSSYLSHHACHAYKSFNASEFNEALVVVRDGRGSEYTLTDGSTAYETTSLFYFNKNSSPVTLYKKLHRDASMQDVKNLMPYNEQWQFDFDITSRHDVGHFYALITTHLGLGNINSCGKLMGLAPYGKPNAKINSLIYDGKEFTNTILKSHWEVDIENYPFLNPYEESNREDLKSLAFETQKVTETICLDLVKKYKHISNNIVLTGGVALNISANSYIVNNLPDTYNFYIDPLCGDEGNSIGAVQLFHEYQNNVQKTIYIGGFNQDVQLKLEDGESLITADNDYVCNLIAGGEIVALFQGKSEAGPRALGNRSILFDPRVVNGNDIVNEIKCREKFRPFAATILLEDLEEWFEVKNVKESSHMMYTFICKQGVEKIIPSVIHVDNTCRLQTIKRDDNPHYYDIIKSFKDKTGVPLLLNTSFNLAGDPLVETLEDALDTMRKSNINYMYLPEIGKVIHSPKYLQ